MLPVVNLIYGDGVQYFLVVAQIAIQCATTQVPVSALGCVILHDLADFHAMLHIQHASNLSAQGAQKMQTVALCM